jgi:hypothetical protein
VAFLFIAVQRLWHLAYYDPKAIRAAHKLIDNFKINWLLNFVWMRYFLVQQFKGLAYHDPKTKRAAHWQLFSLSF